MDGWDAWDWAVLAVSGYVALVTLAHLMRRRHERLVSELLEQVHLEKRKRKHTQKMGPAEPPPRGAA